MAELSGDALKLRIDGIAFRVRTCTVDVRGGMGDLSNSEEEAYTRRKRVKSTLVVRFDNASWDPAENLHIVPISILFDDEVHLEIFPAGLDGDKYDSPTFQFDTVTHNFDAGSATGLQPITASGESNGIFTVPGEVA
jgi:hypothetical protein